MSEKMVEISVDDFERIVNGISSIQGDFQSLSGFANGVIENTCDDEGNLVDEDTGLYFSWIDMIRKEGHKDIRGLREMLGEVSDWRKIRLERGEEVEDKVDFVSGSDIFTTYTTSFSLGDDGEVVSTTTEVTEPRDTSDDIPF